jgi:hypothetical protein
MGHPLRTLTYSMQTSRLGRLLRMAALAAERKVQARRLESLAVDGRCRSYCGLTADWVTRRVLERRRHCAVQGDGFARWGPP